MVLHHLLRDTRTIVQLVTFGMVEWHQHWMQMAQEGLVMFPPFGEHCSTLMTTMVIIIGPNWSH